MITNLKQYKKILSIILCFVLVFPLFSSIMPVLATDSEKGLAIKVYWYHNTIAKKDRATEVTAKMLSDGTEVDTIKLTKDNVDLSEGEDTWVYKIDDLSKYDEYDNLSISLEDIEGYELVNYPLNTNSINEHEDEYNTYSFSAYGKVSDDSAKDIKVSVVFEETPDIDNVPVSVACHEGDTYKYFYGMNVKKGSDPLKWNGTIKVPDNYEYDVEAESISGYEANYEEDGDTYIITLTKKQTKDDTDKSDTDAASKKINITIKNVFDDNDNEDGLRPESMTFGIKQNNKKIKSFDLGDGNDWEKTIEGLPKYDDDENIVDYEATCSNLLGDLTSVDENYYTSVKDETDDDGNITFTFTHKYEQPFTGIGITKTWEDNKDAKGIRPDEITVNIKLDGKVVKTVKLNEKNNWTTGDTSVVLPRYKNKELVGDKYEIEEVAVDGYKSNITKEGEIDHYDFTIVNKISASDTDNNSDNQDTTDKTDKTDKQDTDDTNKSDDTTSDTSKVLSFSVKNVWADSADQDGIRPSSIKVQLYNNGKAEGKAVTLNDKNKWVYTFTNLATDGKYTVREVNIPAGYSVGYAGDTTNGFIITNKHAPETITVSGKKTWDDNDNYDKIRPEKITVILRADGEQVDTMEVDQDMKWEYSFKDLAKYKEGKEIVYTIREEEVKGYTASYKGYDITNTHKTEKSTNDSSSSTESTDSTAKKDSDSQTSDTTQTALYTLLLALATFGTIGVVVYKKKYEVR